MRKSRMNFRDVRCRKRSEEKDFELALKSLKTSGTVASNWRLNWRFKPVEFFESIFLTLNYNRTNHEKSDYIGP
jgi:hypothetical protein